MRHRVYKLSNRFSMLGLEVADWGFILTSWMMSIQVLGLFMAPRPKLLVSVLITIVAFKLWQLVKDRVPQKFGLHLIAWLGEGETYRMMPDTESFPVIVDPKQVEAERRRPNLSQAKEVTVSYAPAER